MRGSALPHHATNLLEIRPTAPCGGAIGPVVADSRHTSAHRGTVLHNAEAHRRIAAGARVANASRMTDASCDRWSDQLEALWLRNTKIPANLPCQIVVDLAVARNGASRTQLSVLPPGMPRRPRAPRRWNELVERFVRAATTSTAGDADGARRREPE